VLSVPLADPDELNPDELDPDLQPLFDLIVGASSTIAAGWIDGAGAIDDEVRADARELVELGVGHVGRERVERGAVRRRDGDVLDDHVRVAQPEGVEAIVALGVAAHLGLALGGERDRRLLDPRPGRIGGEGRRRERDRAQDDGDSTDAASSSARRTRVS